MSQSSATLRATTWTALFCSIIGAAMLAAILVIGGSDPLAEDRYVKVILILTFGCLFCCIGIVLGMVGAMKSRHVTLGIAALVIGLVAPMALLGITFAYAAR